MVKKAALLNDISGLGKCSLTADISVVTAMGIQACPVPTGVYTAQTGFPGYEYTELTDMIPSFRRMWKNTNVMPDGILTGFILNEKQADDIGAFIGDFHTDENILLVDPVMADHGRYYANYSPGLLERVRRLAGEADIITPNISELCLLAGVGFGEVLTLAGDGLIEKLKEISFSLIKGGKADTAGAGSGPDPDKTIVVTGIPLQGDNGEEMLGNLIVDSKDGTVRDGIIKSPYIKKPYSGTGDLFAAVVFGSVINGEDIFTGAALAGEFIAKSVRSAAENDVPSNEGTDYEPYLYTLAGNTRKRRGS